MENLSLTAIESDVQDKSPQPLPRLERKPSPKANINDWVSQNWRLLINGKVLVLSVLALAIAGVVRTINSASSIQTGSFETVGRELVQQQAQQITQEQIYADAAAVIRGNHPFPVVDVQTDANGAPVAYRVDVMGDRLTVPPGAVVNGTAVISVDTHPAIAQRAALMTIELQEDLLEQAKASVVHAKISNSLHDPEHPCYQKTVEGCVLQSMRGFDLELAQAMGAQDFDGMNANLFALSAFNRILLNQHGYPSGLEPDTYRLAIGTLQLSTQRLNRLSSNGQSAARLEGMGQ